MSNRFQHLEMAPSLQASGLEVVREQPLQAATQAELEGRFEPALQSYSTALRKDPALAEAWAGQVRCLVAMEEYREAQIWARKAATVLPAAPETHSALAYALARAGLPEDGLSASDIALELEGSQPNARLWLERACCLMGQQRWPAAEACLQKLGESRHEPDWQQRQAMECLAFGQPHAGVRLLLEVTAARPDRAYAWLLLGRGYRALGQGTNSERAFAQAQSLSPGWEAIAWERRRAMGWPSWMLVLISWFKKGA